MVRATKTLAQMKANPLDWRIESLQSVAEAYRLVVSATGRKPRYISTPEWRHVGRARAPADKADLHQEFRAFD